MHADLRAAHDALEGARTELQRLRDALTHDEVDVERLEGRSAARVWSSLRGSCERDLERERAEAQTAAAAVDAHVAAAAVELARRRELREVEQARTAGRSALQGLLAAQQTLDSAGSWSTWDTFGGGGMLSSAMKHERLDEARQRLQVAGDGLARFTRELDDLRMPGISLPEFSGLVRGIDIWWDNVGVDLLVGEQIRRTQRDVEAAVARVEEALDTLETRRAPLVG